MRALLRLRIEFTIDSRATVRNHPAPRFTIPSARSLCSTTFWMEGCCAGSKFNPGLAMCFLREETYTSDTIEAEAITEHEACEKNLEGEPWRLHCNGDERLTGG